MRMVRILGSDEVRRGSFLAANTNLPTGPEKLNWRTSQRGNSYVIVDGFHAVVFRRQTGLWGVRIEEIESGESWYSEPQFPNENAARAGAFQELKSLAAKARPVRAVRM